MKHLASPAVYICGDRKVTVTCCEEIMNVRHNSVVGWALGGFALGTVMAVAYVASGASLLVVTEDWARLALYPGFVVGYHTFDLLGYSAAVSLACLAVGGVYSAIASAVGTTVRKVVALFRAVKVA